MRVSRWLAFAAAAALLAPLAARAQNDVSGTWWLSASVVLPDREIQTSPCLYQGTAEVVEIDGQISGPATLSLVSGPFECPAEMMAELAGTVVTEGNALYVSGTLDGGKELGLATFTGLLGEPGVGAMAERADGGDGELAVQAGPFTGASGTWAAVMRASVLAIPGLTPVGLALLALLLLGGGLWTLHRLGGS